MKAVLLGLLFVAGSVYADSVTFCDVCTGYTVSKRGNDVLIRCPGKTEPWMTFKNCLNPVAKRNGNSVTIICGGK